VDDCRGETLEKDLKADTTAAKRLLRVIQSDWTGSRLEARVFMG
jgi:hypothetical protein